MAFIEYKSTLWVDILPTIGLQCPNDTCGGFIEGNNFTDKKGKEWKSVVCKNCLTKWIQSHIPPKNPATPQIEHKTSVSSEGVELLQRILGLLENIDGNIATLILKHEGGEEAELTETGKMNWAEAKSQ